MKILGIETSCDECAASIVEDGSVILSNIVATQIPFHSAYNGVVPEIASRKHIEWIYSVVEQAFSKAGVSTEQVDGVAVTSEPGLTGSLMVGLNFAKAFSYARKKPFIACNHILAHLYAVRLCAAPPPYPYLGLLASGGHTIICKILSYDKIEVLGTTVDDAAGEAFDKVSRHFGWGYPGGRYVDELAARGNEDAYCFPKAKLRKNGRRYDVSYSGLKTAVINNKEQFRRVPAILEEDDAASIAASFQKAAIDMLVEAVLNAAEDTGLKTVVCGGGAASNSRLRRCLENTSGIKAYFPPPLLCADNAAMVAGLGFNYIKDGGQSSMSVSANSKIKDYKRRYPR